MSRLIDADKGLISKIQLKTGCNFITAQEIVDSMPSVEERKVAKWIKQYTAFVNDDNQIVVECHCSNCYGIAYFRSLGNKLAGANYCPVCGSFMESED